MKMKYILPLILLISFFASQRSLSQILNSNFEYDKEDVDNILALQGIEVFKMPIPDDGKKYNLLMIQYDKGGRIDTFNFYQKLQENIAENIAREILVQRNDESKELRFYFQKLPSDTLSMLLVLPSVTLNFSLPFENTDSFKTGAKAFNMQNKIGNYYRILVLYNSSENKMHCAMDDTDTDLLKRMSKVISFYLEPID